MALDDLVRPRPRPARVGGEAGSRYSAAALLTSPEQAGRRAHQARDRALEILLGVPPTEAAPSDDLPLPPLGGRAGGTVRGLFQALREQGLQPHPFGERYDDAFLQWLKQAREARQVTRPFDPHVSVPEPPPPAPLLESERWPESELAAPSPYLGVNNARTLDGRDEASASYGTWREVARDLASLSAGTLRHPKGKDLTWLDLFPGTDGRGEVIPEPLDVYERVTAVDADWGECGVVQRTFGALLTLCMTLGIQVEPTLWCLGGGENKVEAAVGSDAPGFAPGIREVFGRAPYVMTEAGWSEWYHKYTDLTEYDGEEPASPPVEEDVRDWCRYSFSLFWEWDKLTLGARRSCRRKGLAVAAFSLGLGEFFSRWSHALRQQGRRITDVVPYLECGNEMEGLMPDDLEGGRFMALLAGPLWSLAPEVRFRVGELASWVAEGEWANKMTWLAGVLGVPEGSTALDPESGMPAEVGRWRAVLAMEVDQLEWLSDCMEAVFFWPPWTGSPLGACEGTVTLPTSACQLAHQVGFHWYHQTTDTYEPAPVLQSDTAALVAVVERARTRGYDLTWSVGEVGFNAVNDDGPLPVTGPLNPWASEEFQASELVRRMLLQVALGAERVCWHSHMSIIYADYPTDLYGAHGLRNDIGAIVDEELVFSQGANARRRPSYLAFRRLAALLACTREVRICLNQDEKTVLLLTAASGYEGAHGERYDRAVVAWYDQEAAAEEFELELWDLEGRGWELLSLVPQVTASADAVPPVDANGFAAGETVDWEWEGWAAPVETSSAPLPGVPAHYGASDVITVHVRRLSSTQPAPVCLLTNAWSPLLAGTVGPARSTLVARGLAPEAASAVLLDLVLGRVRSGVAESRAALEACRTAPSAGRPAALMALSRSTSEMGAMAANLREILGRKP